MALPRWTGQGAGAVASLGSQAMTAPPPGPPQPYGPASGYRPPQQPHGPGPEFYPPAGAWPQSRWPVQEPGPLAAAGPSRSPSKAKAVLTWVAIGVLLTVCTLLTVLAIALDTGVTGLVVGFVLAVLPVFPVVAAFLWLDRHEAEPASLLLLAFWWGAAVATLVSLVLNTASALLLQRSGGSPEIAMFTVAPVVEETTKGLAVVAVLLLRRREFDGVVDGIVYAGMAGIGFAFIENVLYFGRSFVDGGSGAVAAVFVMRGVFSPFAHPLFTMAIGVGIGIAVTRRGKAARVLAPALGWLVAVLLHAAWNGSTLLGLQGFVGAYAFLQVPVFLGAITVALMARRRESRLLGRHLQLYASRGWLTPGEAAMLASLSQRRQARAWAASTTGPRGRRAMRDFQELASEVAFLRERMTRGTASADAADSERRMLHGMWHLRPHFSPQPRELTPV